jgi:hypothetical protein
MRVHDVLIGSVLALLPLAGCVDPPPPRDPASGASCAKAYRASLCPGDERCETDANGCERCTCDTPPELAPGPERD